MNDGEEFHETCAGCGRVAEGGRPFCHFYPDGRIISFCSPACAETFLELPAELHLGAGARDGDRVDVAPDARP